MIRHKDETKADRYQGGVQTAPQPAVHANPEEREPGEIQADIERTRAHMDQSLDELGERLKPSHMMSRAAKSFRGVRWRRIGSYRVYYTAGRALLNKMRKPSKFLALAALAGWFIFQSGSSKRRGRAKGKNLVNQVRSIRSMQSKWRKNRTHPVTITVQPESKSGKMVVSVKS